MKTWLVAVSLVALALFVPGLADPYQASRLFTMACVAAALCIRKSDNTSAMVPALIFGGICWFVSSLFTHDFSLTMGGSRLSQFDGFAAVAVYAALAVGVARLGASVDEVAESICWASLPVSAYAVVQRILGNSDPLLPAQLPGNVVRVISTQGYPLHLGLCLALVVVCAVSVIPRRRWLGWASLVGAVVGVALSGSRGPVLALGLAALVWRPRLALVVIGSAALLLLVAMPRTGTFESDMGRLANWDIAWRIFKDHPLVGTGPGTFQMVSRQYITIPYIIAQHSATIMSAHAHNQALHVMATTGLVGLIGYAVAALSVVAVALFSCAHRKLLLSVLVVYAVCSLINPVVHSATFLLAALFGAASSIKRGEGVVPSRLPVLASLVVAAAVISFRSTAGEYYLGRAARCHSSNADIARFLRYAYLVNPSDQRLVSLHLETVMISENDPQVGIRYCLAVARKNLAKHPHNSYASEAAGKFVLQAYMMGLPESPVEAAAHFRRAFDLAPTYTGIIRRRLVLARAMGDKRTEAIVRNKYEVVAQAARGI